MKPQDHEDFPDTCDGIEQEAWEAHGKQQRLDMGQHPMFYLFLDPKTAAARDAWKAGLMHGVERIRAILATETAPTAPEIGAFHAKEDESGVENVAAQRAGTAPHYMVVTSLARVGKDTENASQSLMYSGFDRAEANKSFMANRDRAQASTGIPEGYTVTLFVGGVWIRRYIVGRNPT